MRDIDVRLVLKAMLATQHRRERNTLVLDELGICNGSVLVDIAVLNGALHGYEIKSACDTLSRLPRQVEVYGRVLDYATLVVAEGHRKKATAKIPKWWGIVVAQNQNGRIKLTKVRKSQNNPAVIPQHLASLLWRDEALALLEKCQAAQGYRSCKRAVIYARLAEVMPIKRLKYAVLEVLKARVGWRQSAAPTVRRQTSYDGPAPDVSWLQRSSPVISRRRIR